MRGDTMTRRSRDGLHRELTPQLMRTIAERFKVLAEPARLQLLNALRKGETTVSELVERTGLGQANVSKHLQLLHAHGFVTRRKDGLYVHYRVSNDEVFVLCDIMCGGLPAEGEPRRGLRPTG
jgi:DNA-binding transcriptional ArsR family regulator